MVWCAQRDDMGWYNIPWAVALDFFIFQTVESAVNFKTWFMNDMQVFKGHWKRLIIEVGENCGIHYFWQSSGILFISWPQKKKKNWCFRWMRDLFYAPRLIFLLDVKLKLVEFTKVSFHQLKNMALLWNSMVVNKVFFTSLSCCMNRYVMPL